ncbi:MAG TPA: hypothetical protein VFZ70_01070 [Euzebyales bacterium]
MIDRSLGRYQVPQAVRGRGATAYTLFDLYGEHEQEMPDVEWLSDAGQNGYPILTADKNIRRTAEELAEVERCAVVMFALPNSNMSGSEQVARFMTNWNRILQACRKPGPRIYSVHANRIVQVYP